uniref:Replication protein A 32 kDa subunit-like n=1 Tax=Takifugu rubripes TaxID=31033 RepID=A0A674MHE0_TAKRU
MTTAQATTKVSVVGVVRRSAHYDTNVQYCVDDMTGPPLLVKQWVGEEATPICPGTYVKVTGCLRGGSDQKVLLALNVRCLQELNEITSHMMEVVQAHMQLFGKAFDVNMNPTAGPGAGGVLPIGLSTIQGEVLHVIRTYAASGDGIGIHELKTQLGFLSSTDLRTSLAFLLNEGHIFSTVDQHHFKSTEH